MEEKEKGALEKNKDKLFCVMQKVLNDTKIGKLQFIFISLLEFFTLFAFWFHDEVIYIYIYICRHHSIGSLHLFIGTS